MQDQLTLYGQSFTKSPVARNCALRFSVLVIRCDLCRGSRDAYSLSAAAAFGLEGFWSIILESVAETQRTILPIRQVASARVRP
jgi:hypothetical protein